jgi:hypothetical protein
VSGFETGAITYDPAAGTAVITEANALELVPRVVVKLAEGLPVPLADGATVDMAGLGALLGPLALTPVVVALEQQLGDAAIRRVFDSMPAAELTALVAEGQAADPTYDPPDLLSFFEIDVPDGVDPHGVADLLNAWVGVVEDAYVSAIPSNPVTGTTNPLFSQQGFLASGPTGVDAAAAWAKGADGTGLRLIDLELGWFLGHEDFVPHQIRLLAGVNIVIFHGHGTAVVGTIIGRDNTLGGVGLAPAARVDLMSWASPGEAPGWHNRHTVAVRIADAAKVLSAGDVLLLESQFSNHGGTPHLVPVETQSDVYEAIRLATAKGVIVVEAAGNGEGDLDRFTKKGKHVLDRTSADFHGESGAIMVGACRSVFPRGAHPKSNVGSRVDCHAWGDHVVVPGSFDDPHNPFKYFLPPLPDVGDVPFGHTSGASAIIAGVCLLIQHLRSILTAKDGTTGRLRPDALQALLRNPANGSLMVPGKIGPMPDLALIIANHFK